MKIPKKIEPIIEEKNQKIEEGNNVIKLETQKEKDEIEIFDKENQDNNKSEIKPLILTQEVQREKVEKPNNDQNWPELPSIL